MWELCEKLKTNPLKWLNNVNQIDKMMIYSIFSHFFHHKGVGVTCKGVG